MHQARGKGKIMQLRGMHKSGCQNRGVHQAWSKKRECSAEEAEGRSRAEGLAVHKERSGTV